MVNHVEILRQGHQVWNAWRRSNPETVPELAGANLSAMNLRRYDLRRALLDGANLTGAALSYAWLSRASLRGAVLRGGLLYRVKAVLADFTGADFSFANLRQSRFEGAEFSGAKFDEAILVGARFTSAKGLSSDTLRTGALSVGDLQRHVRESLLDQEELTREDMLTLEMMPSFNIGRVTLSPGDSPDQKTKYTVWYATNRRPLARTPLRFGAERDQALNYGKCTVNIPRTHRIGGVVPWWRRLLGQGGETLEIEQTRPLDDVDYWRGLATECWNLTVGRRDVVVFVHGYNVSFEECILRAAQIGADLKLPTIAAFSWPSKGDVPGYLPDSAAIEASEVHLRTFLEGILSNTQADNVHVIAHSMGNRGVLRCISRAMSDIGRFGNLVLAAPDVDQDVLRHMAPQFLAHCGRVTLYASDRDRALQVSGHLHDFPRAGLLPPITVVSGIDTVDVSGVDLSALGHGYVASNRAVLQDLHALIVHDAAPDARFGLMPSADGAYWRISP